MSQATSPKGRISYRSRGVAKYRKELKDMIKKSKDELRREVRSAIKRAHKDHADGGTGIAIIQEGGAQGRKPWARVLIGNCTREAVDEMVRELLPEGWTLEHCRLHSHARRELTDWRLIGHFPVDPVE